MLKKFFKRELLIPTTFSLFNIVILLFLLFKESRLLELMEKVFLTSIGGIVAALLANYLSQKSRVENKRKDAYIKHKNAVVQMEQELLAARIEIDRDIQILENSINFNSETKTRLILKMYKPDFSSGLGLRLLSVDFINKYYNLFLLFRKINLNIDYLSVVVADIRSGLKKNDLENNYLSTYRKIVGILFDQLKQAESDTLELIIMSESLLDLNEKEIISKFLENGKEINYNIPIEIMDKRKAQIFKNDKKLSKRQSGDFMAYRDVSIKSP